MSAGNLRNRTENFEDGVQFRNTVNARVPETSHENMKQGRHHLAIEDQTRSACDASIRITRVKTQLQIDIEGNNFKKTLIPKHNIYIS